MRAKPYIYDNVGGDFGPPEFLYIKCDNNILYIVQCMINIEIFRFTVALGRHGFQNCPAMEHCRLSNMPIATIGFATTDIKGYPCQCSHGQQHQRRHLPILIAVLTQSPRVRQVTALPFL